MLWHTCIQYVHIIRRKAQIYGPRKSTALGEIYTRIPRLVLPPSGKDKASRPLGRRCQTRASCQTVKRKKFPVTHTQGQGRLAPTLETANTGMHGVGAKGAKEEKLQRWLLSPAAARRWALLRAVGGTGGLATAVTSYLVDAVVGPKRVKIIGDSVHQLP